MNWSEQNLLSIERFLRRAEEMVPDAEWEKFLADEGLELLAAYRLIKDRRTRRALLSLVKAVSRDVSARD